jgi:TolB protein
VTYSSDEVDRDEIYTVAATGGIPRRITNRPGYLAFEPSFSPVLSDGSRWIVFESHKESNPDCCGELWKVRIDGTDLVRLTAGFDDRQPEWSPRGDKIAFQRQVSPDNWDIFTIDSDGDSPFNVTNNPTAGNTDCSWSPSGNYIVYSAGGTDINVANLFIIAASGGTPLRLTNSCGLDGAPGWSPDGSKIAFESAPFDPDLKGSTAIWIINAPHGVK